METAQGSIVVDLSAEEAHDSWLRFIGEGERGVSTSERDETGISRETESGRVHFVEESPKTTRVTMELRFNPQAVKEAGRVEDWVARRIDIYLRRFRDHCIRR